MKKRKRTNHIVLLGNYGAKNIGDEAIFASLLFYCKKNYGEDTRISVLTDHHEYVKTHLTNGNIQCYPLFPVGFRSILRHLLPALRSRASLKNADMVLFGGGGLFTDSVSFHAVLIWFVQFVYVHYYLGLEVHTYGQSIGPLKSRLAQSLTAFAMKHMKTIRVRDKRSLQWLQARQINGSLISDPALTLPPSGETQDTSESTALHIALSIRPWGHTTEIMDMITRIITQKYPKAVIHLIPMQVGTDHESDIEIMSHLARELSTQGISYEFHKPTSYPEVQQILTQCHVAIGMRLHFCILAATQHLPFYALSYSTKVSEVATELGMPWSTVEDLTEKSLQDALEALVNTKEALKKELSEKMSVIRSQHN